VRTSRCCLILLGLCIAGFAQSNYAGISGTVLDPQRTVLPGAAIKVTAVATGATRTATSTPQGLFEIAGLQPGEYVMEISSPGFNPSKTKFRLEVGQQLTSEVTLNVGSTHEDVDVTARVDVLRTTDPSVGEVIEPKAVRELPLNGRMLVDLMLTVPGAHIGHGAQTGDMNPLYWRPGQRSAVSIGGNRPNANYFLLDGNTNTDPTFNTLNLSPSPDAVQEFKVQTSSYSAEMGGAGGGQVNIVTRSGGNQFHGTIYEFLRNNVLDAHTFNDMGSNHFVQNNFGASASGPITKNTFFFVNYESLRHTKAMTMVETVPTLDEISGDFSMSGTTIYNPLSAHPNPAFDPTKPISKTNPQIIRDPFPGNVIPQSMISAVAQAFMKKYVPAPNLERGMIGGTTMMGAPVVVGAGMDSNNYMDVRNERHVTDQGTMRVDHAFTNGDSLSGRYSLSAENGFMPQNLPGFGAFHDNLSQHGSVTWTRLLSSHLLNIGSFTISRLAMHRSSENNESNDIVSELGIQGVGFGGMGAFGAPWFNVQGYSGMGDSFAATPMKAWDTIFELRDSVSWQKGRHGLKFGGSYRRYIWPMWGFFQNRGYYQFTNGFTTQTATNDGTGSALASFLLGLPAVRQRQAGVPQMQLRQWYADGFAQDTWQVTSTTTIDFGLRYEYMSPLKDIRYANTNLVFQNGQPMVFVGGQNGYPEGLMYANKLNFAPRVGIAQHVPGLGLVIHTAYGIFYTPVDMNTWCNQRHNVPYVFPETNQSDNFIPSITSFNFAQPVLGKTVVSFAAFDPHAPAQYIQQWSASVEKSLGKETTLEIGYLGSRGFHLQRSHLINNALPGPGAIQPRRPYKTLAFIPGTDLPADVTVQSTTFPVSGINLLENSARSWYDAGYVNLRRRYAHGFSVLANYTWAKSLSDAPDFRSPMFESAIPQNNNDLAAEKGPACDIRHRFALSAVYDIPALSRWSASRVLTKDWHLSTVYQAQSGFPFTISVFGDTANSGTLLGENPIRANATGQPIFPSGTRNSTLWFNPSAFATPAAFTFGNVGRNSVYGPGLQTMDVALYRGFNLTERARLEIRGEFFNALNHTNLGTPNRFVNTPQFGTITEAATPGREVQLGARISF
jgi:Carboxypeptidase regulatory-like domain